MCIVRSKRRRLVMAARCNIRHLAHVCKRGRHLPSPPLGFNIAFMRGPALKFEIGRLPARSARTASLQLRREHHSAILNKEGKGDVAYETGHAVRCVKRHARVGGARFCPPPVGVIIEILVSHNVSLGFVDVGVLPRSSFLHTTRNATFAQ